VVRDMIQNHLQRLCLTAIEPPVAFKPQSLRDETWKFGCDSLSGHRIPDYFFHNIGKCAFSAIVVLGRYGEVVSPG
jgi:hypothetical protein